MNATRRMADRILSLPAHHLLANTLDTHPRTRPLARHLDAYTRWLDARLDGRAWPYDRLPLR